MIRNAPRKDQTGYPLASALDGRTRPERQQYEFELHLCSSIETRIRHKSFPSGPAFLGLLIRRGPSPTTTFLEPDLGNHWK